MELTQDTDLETEKRKREDERRRREEMRRKRRAAMAAIQAKDRALPEYVHQDAFCEELCISRKTLDRYRAKGLAYARIAGRIFIHIPS